MPLNYWFGLVDVKFVSNLFPVVEMCEWDVFDLCLIFLFAEIYNLVLSFEIKLTRFL